MNTDKLQEKQGNTTPEDVEKVDDNQEQVGEEEQPTIDEDEVNRIAENRTARAERSAIKSYFKQQGLSEAEAQEAFENFKAKKAEAKEAEMQDINSLRSKVEKYEQAESEAMRIANRRLVRADAKVMAVTLNIKPERIEHAIRLADLSGVDVDDKGNVDGETLREALEKVVEEIPELLIASKTDEENKPGFKLGGSGGKSTISADALSKIFGNK